MGVKVYHFLAAAFDMPSPISATAPAARAPPINAAPPRTPRPIKPSVGRVCVYKI